MSKLLNNSFNDLLKPIVAGVCLVIASGCSSMNPIKDAHVNDVNSIQEVQTSSKAPVQVRWGGEVTAIEYLGKDSLIHLQVTEELKFTRPSAAEEQGGSVSVIVVTPNMDARSHYRNGELITLLGTAQIDQNQNVQDKQAEAIWVMPDAIYSWLDMRDNRQYDSTGIIAMSDFDNQLSVRLVQSPWKNQDETDPMMQRQPIFKQPSQSNRLVLFTQ